MEIGRVCIKKYGRDAGSRAVVVKILDNGFVNVVTGVRPKERKCNPKHLEFLDEKVDINDKAQLNRVLGVKPKVEHASKKAAKK